VAIKSTQRKLKSVGKKKTNTRFILVRPQPVPKSSPQATNGSWDFFQPCKILYKQRSTRDVPFLVLFEQPSGCTLHLNWSTRDVPSLVLSITTQVDVPSTCATKNVSSNVLGQRILRQLVLWIFVRGNKRYLRWLVLWNLLFKGKEWIKRILRRLVLWILLEEGEGRHKRTQVVSPSILLTRGRRNEEKE